MQLLFIGLVGNKRRVYAMLITHTAINFASATNAYQGQ
jgi:hypothetical protein